ncbi:hypothetical protein K488DRAFT_84513 [Vararia minispora EC-137]|uniref:Uncharacterized protein n=1 Tax=Vararia minispora EC-137 TaxID=1314806 RepID=A0ACB8QPS2_9AGAM|nr:hypothetical protein K488DRAFT_84513 [Vararia minispora EC-137]
MSSSFTPEPVQTQPPDNTQGSSPSAAGIGGPSSSLYLYTFLVTLALLLAISASIIVRSYLIRRRIRRMIADGTWVPPAERLSAVAVGAPAQRPKLFEVWVGGEKGVPLAASFLDRIPASASSTPSTPSLADPPAPRRFAWLHRARGAVSLTSLSPRIAEKSVEKPSVDDTGTLQLALFVAMPTPVRAGLELPPLELGVCAASKA